MCLRRVIQREGVKVQHCRFEDIAQRMPFTATGIGPQNHCQQRGPEPRWKCELMMARLVNLIRVAGADQHR